MEVAESENLGEPGRCISKSVGRDLKREKFAISG